MGEIQPRAQAVGQLYDPSPLLQGCVKGAALASDAELPLPVLGTSCLVFLHFPVCKNEKAFPTSSRTGRAQEERCFFSSVKPTIKLSRISA